MKYTLLLSAAPLALISASASAQDVAAANTGSAAKSAAEAKQDTTAQEVVVTGFKASLRSAQQIKRNSDSIVDVVVAEDIGKLPDLTAAESLARVTGVQVERFSDEANRVLVRGLPDVATTVNGRDIFTAELRRVQMQDFPSGAIAALEIYKSGTADLLEPGLAGLVNVRTQRPFDFKGFTVGGGIRITYNDQTKKKDPTGNLLISDRWDTPIGELGVLVNFSRAQSTYRNAVRWDSTWIVTPNPGQVITPSSVGHNFSFPEAVGVYNDGGKRWRPAANGSIQWKPAYNVEIYSDFVYQGYRGRSANDWMGISMRYLDPALSNVTLVPGTTDQAAGFTKTGGNRAEMYRSTGSAYTNTYQIALGGKWDTGRAHLSTDMAWTTSTYDAKSWSFDSATNSAPTVNVLFDAKGGAAFSLPGFDNKDPANYHWRGYYEDHYRPHGTGFQWRGDISWDTGLAGLPTLQMGVRYTNRDAILQRGARYAYTDDLRLPLTSLPVGDLELTQDAFRGNEQGWRNWLMPTRSGIAGNAAKLRQATRDALTQLIPTHPWMAADLARYQSEDVPYDPAATFSATERSYALYGQGKYKFTVGGIDVDGVVGVRVVNTDGDYSGVSTVLFNQVTSYVPRTVSQNYIDVLPNASLRIHATDKLQLRFAFTKTRTRPDFGQLNPSYNITQNTRKLDPTVPAKDKEDMPDAYGSAGNPDLKPLTSKNYDATIEYYFSKNNYVSVQAFYRDLFGFFSNYTKRVTDPVYGLLEVSRPENAGAGKIKGVELGGQAFLDFLPGPLSGFGVQANLTYIDGKNKLPTALVPNPPYARITGLSKWSYNATLIYEKGDISTRLSYNGRSKWVNWYGQATTDGSFTGSGTQAITRLDYSFNYSPIKSLTLTFDVNNILAKPFKNYNAYTQGREFPIDVRYEGRYFGFGARFRFE